MPWMIWLSLLALIVGTTLMPIDADNVKALRSVARIDYADAPPEAGRIESAGGFALSGDGNRIAVRNREGGVVTWSAAGELIDVFAVPGADGLPETVFDIAFNEAGTLLAAVASDGAAYSVVVRELENDLTLVHPFPNAPDVPLRVWFDGTQPALWMEVASAENEPGYALQIPYALPGQVATTEELTRVPLGPETDPTAEVRFGRIVPPYAVTASEQDQVTLWNLELEEPVAVVQAAVMPVFGGLNAPATHLAWRDDILTSLRLLDFTTGEDREITPLNGDYISFIVVNPNADVVLGVDVNDEPVIVAWDAATGERTELGAYRDCERAPDMARRRFTFPRTPHAFFNQQPRGRHNRRV